jgi:hypothetical protein
MTSFISGLLLFVFVVALIVGLFLPKGFED